MAQFHFNLTGFLLSILTLMSIMLQIIFSTSVVLYIFLDRFEDL